MPERPLFHSPLALGFALTAMSAAFIAPVVQAQETPPVETVPRPAPVVPTTTPPAPDAAPPVAPPRPSALAPTDSDSERMAKEAALRRRLIPEPMSADRLGALAEALGLDDKGRNDLDAARRRYEDLCRAARSVDMRDLEILLPASFRFNAVSKDFQPVHTPELLALLRLRAKINDRLLAAERQFDRDLDGLCAADHRGTWRALRMERGQELYGHPPRLPAADVNLLELIPKAGVPAEELTALESFFERYSEGLLVSLRARHTRLLALEREQAETLVSLGPEWRAGRTLEEAIAVDRSLGQIDMAAVLADSDLRQLNDRSVSSLRSLLPAVSWRKVVEAYHRVVHPELYEDERSFRILVEEMVGLPAMQADGIGQVVDTLVRLEEHLRPFGQQAADLADGMIAVSSLHEAEGTAARILLQSKLLATLERRRSAVRDATVQLSHLLPETEARFTQRLADSLKTLTAMDRASRFLREGLDARAGEVEMLRAMGQTPSDALPPPRGAANPGDATTRPAGPPEAQPTSPEGTSGSPTPPPPPKPDRPESRGSRGSRRR